MVESLTRCIRLFIIAIAAIILLSKEKSMSSSKQTIFLCNAYMKVQVNQNFVKCSVTVYSDIEDDIDIKKEIIKANLVTYFKNWEKVLPASMKNNIIYSGSVN